MKKNKVELLAPAGNREAFYGAIVAGADAVYLGGAKYSARAYAENFSEADIVECIRYAHVWGRRVYLTVNTLMKEEELEELHDYLAPLYQAGLDGVIVQDMGAFSLIREAFPDMELHVSTQMAVTGVEGARFLRDMGAVRIVPARELTLEEIAAIKRELPDLEIETFIHGAMCYSYSGQCLFSSVLGGRSGNRGRCAQPCRLPYQVEGGSKTAYLLSLKDMNTIDYIAALGKAGISSFKIEGRMKSPEYAAGVTAIYRKYLDAYLAHPDTSIKVADSDKEVLNSLYIRSQVQEGYYFRHNDKDMVTKDSPAYRKTDERILEGIRERYLGRTMKKPVELYACLMEETPASLTCISGEYSVTVEGNMVGTAIKQPMSMDQATRQLGKLGDTNFELTDLNITLGDKVFYSLRELNELRREGIRLLEAEIIRGMGFTPFRDLPGRKDKPAPDGSDGREEEDRRKTDRGIWDGIAVSVRTKDQLEGFLAKGGDFTPVRLYVEGDLLYHDSSLVTRMEKLAQETQIWLALPYVIRKRDKKFLEGMDQLLKTHIFAGCMVRNMEGYGLLRSLDRPVDIRLDAGMYLWNRRAIDFWSDKSAGWCLPLELGGREQIRLLEGIPHNGGSLQGSLPEKIFYGRTPMMITANCVINTTKGCQKGSKLVEEPVFLRDRYDKLLPVEINCTHCMNIIYNTVPLSLHKVWKQFHGKVTARLDFTTEDGRQMMDTIAYYRQIQMGIDSPPPWRDYTTGHDKKGVL